MMLDWWGLGLQAVNVLILVWLLSRVFWRPMAAAIARRQDAAQALLTQAETAKDAAEMAQAEVDAARADIANAREAILAEAKAVADAETQAALREARSRADALLSAAHSTAARDTEAARKQTATRAAALSAEMAARLLRAFDTPEVRAAFFSKLVAAIAELSTADRTALLASPIEIVAASDPGEAARAEIEEAVRDGLGGTPEVSLTIDPDLIAGLELRTAHFVLHNSWQADLASLLKEVADAR